MRTHVTGTADRSIDVRGTTANNHAPSPMARYAYRCESTATKGSFERVYSLEEAIALTRSYAAST